MSRVWRRLICKALLASSIRWWSSADSSHPLNAGVKIFKYFSDKKSLAVLPLSKYCKIFPVLSKSVFTTSTSWEMANPNLTLTVPFRFSTGRAHFWYFLKRLYNNLSWVLAYEDILEEAEGNKKIKDDYWWYLQLCFPIHIMTEMILLGDSLVEDLTRIL